MLDTMMEEMCRDTIKFIFVHRITDVQFTGVMNSRYNKFSNCIYVYRIDGGDIFFFAEFR